MRVNREHIVCLITGVLLGVAGSFGSLALTNRGRPAPIVIVPPQPTQALEATATPSFIRVYIHGAVAQAAVYELPPNSLVQQAVEMAGGFTAEANTAVINLAQSLSDGVQIYVPAQGEALPVPIPLTTNQTTTSEVTGSSGGGGLININNASQAELERLPGVGPSTARNIITHRETNGPFATIENLMDVSGIGDGRFSQIKDMITVGE